MPTRHSRDLSTRVEYLGGVLGKCGVEYVSTFGDVEPLEVHSCGSIQKAATQHVK